MNSLDFVVNELHQLIKFVENSGNSLLFEHFLGISSILFALSQILSYSNPLKIYYTATSSDKSRISPSTNFLSLFNCTQI